MRSSNFLVLILCFSVLAAPCKLFAQETESEENYPANIRKYNRMYYGGGNKIVAPWDVVFADNNWEILLACLEGTTKDELLEAGVSFGESQLMLLHAMRLLDMQDDNLKTMMPILGSEKMRSLRQRMHSLAIKLGEELQEEVKTLSNELEKIERKSSMFTILFSYALDTLPWQYYEEKGLVQVMNQRTLEKPLWAGVYYACYPPRATSCGTNSESGQGISFKVNWGGYGNKIWKYFTRDNLGILHSDYATHGKIVNEEIRKELAEIKIFDSDGHLTIPVIKESGADLLYKACQAVADKSARLFLEFADIEGQIVEYGFHDREKAIVVSYHEWMWEFLDYLVEKGIMQRPFHFTNWEESTPEDIGSLLIVVDSRNGI